MGLSPSSPSHTYDQIWLPADTFRLCNGNPPACYCRGGHHSRSKYVYVERNNPSGRESYRDPMELVERGMVPPGYWGVANMNMWRPKDYEIMSRVMAQYMANQRGLTEVPWGDMMMGGAGGGLGGMNSMGGMGMGGWQGYGPPPVAAYGPWGPGPWQHSWAAGGHDMGSGERGAVDDYQKMKERVRLLDDLMFGSEADKLEKQADEQMLKRLQTMIPELAKLIALQQAGLGGAGQQPVGMMPGMPGMPPGGQMGMNGMNPFAPGGMPPMNPMVNPYAMAGMNAMVGGGDHGMIGGGGEMGGYGRRRPRGRRGQRDFDFDDDDEDDFGFGRGRGGRRRRRGRYNGLFDDDDFGGDDSRTRRGPPKGPQGPRPGNGGGSGGGGSGGGGGGPGSTGGSGAVFETLNDDARFRSAPAGVPQPSHWASPPRPTAPPPTPMATAQPPGRILTPIQEPLHSSLPPIPVTRPSSAAVEGWPPPGSIPIPQDRAPPYRSHPGTFDMPNPPMYAGSIDGGLSSARPVPGRRVSFRPEGGTSFRPEGAMARPRQDEENRGEPEAGGPAGRHDITPPGPP